MSKMHLVLHIGTEKTGSTTLQNWLVENRAALSRQGVYVTETLGRGNNRKLVAFFHAARDDFWDNVGLNTPGDKARYFDGFLDDFCAEIGRAEADHHSMIISSEHFHSRLIADEEIAALATFCQRNFAGIRVLCWLREQSAVRRSLYNMYSSNRDCGRLEDFQSNIDETSPYYNYFELANRWARQFGKDNLSLRRFDRDAFAGGDLRRDFLAAAGLDLDETALDFTSGAANESVALLVTAAFAGVNLAVPLVGETGRDLRNLLYKAALRQVAELRRGKVEDGMARAIHERFRASNRKLSEAWFDGRELFPAPGQPEPDPDATLGLEEVAAIVRSTVQALARATAPRLLMDADINLLRDIALKHESGGAVTREDAVRLLALAARARPGGALIRNKLAALRAAKPAD